jgi:hypothetical protein
MVIIASLAAVVLVVWVVGILTALGVSAGLGDRFVTSAAAAFIGAYFAYRLNRRAQRHAELSEFRLTALQRIQTMLNHPAVFGTYSIMDFDDRHGAMQELRRQAGRIRNRWLYYLVDSIDLEASRFHRLVDRGEQLAADAMAPAFWDLVSDLNATVEALTHEAVLDLPPPVEPPNPKESEFIFSGWDFR